jgi:hypothetical protein
MWRETARRILVLIVVVALAATFQLRSIQGFSAEAQTTAMNVDMPMHGKCDGCAGNEKAMTPSVCSTFCTTVAALPFLNVAYDPVFAEIIASNVEVATTGHTTPPDPYPPRLSRMS